jgi:hypothetical protein
MNKSKTREPRRRAPKAELLLSQPPIEESVKLDITLTMDNLAKVVRTDVRKGLLQSRIGIQAELNKGQQAHAALEDQLKTHASEIATAQQTDPAAMALANSLTAFTGNAYSVRATSEQVDVDKETVSVKIEVFHARAITSRYSYDYGSDHEIDKTVSVPFTPAMRDLVKKLQEAAGVVREIQGRLARADYHLSHLPELIDEAESALTKAYLSRQLSTGEDVLAILGSVQPVIPALPAPE